MDSVQYKGWWIDCDFYGNGEFTVQANGDDCVFNTLEEAKEFIDQLEDEEE